MPGMIRLGFVLTGFILVSCNSGKTDTKGFSYEKFAELFPPAKTSYQLSDAELLNNKDTTAIRSAEFGQFISDSLKTKLFGRNSKVRYIALARIKASKNTSYYIVKAGSGPKKVALLLPFTNDQFDVVFPFLVPDNDVSTSQLSSVDKSNAIIKAVTQKKQGGETAEGRDVYQYIPDAKQFTLVLTNPLTHMAELINPIDTLPRKHKFSGDYVKDKTNFVSIRDGRSPSELLLFIHIEEGDCSGEIKGTLLMTASATAIYRQGGDPCGLSFRFSGNSVSVKENGGCGSRRGLNCSFEGTYNRKKEAKAKTLKKKTSPK
jgi:hypothetical protein